MQKKPLHDKKCTGSCLHDANFFFDGSRMQASRQAGSSDSLLNHGLPFMVSQDDRDQSVQHLGQPEEDPPLQLVEGSPCLSQRKAGLCPLPLISTVSNSKSWTAKGTKGTPSASHMVANSRADSRYACLERLNGASMVL